MWRMLSCRQTWCAPTDAGPGRPREPGRVFVQVDQPHPVRRLPPHVRAKEPQNRKTNRMWETELIAFACLHVRPVGVCRTCRWADEIELTATHASLHGNREQVRLGQSVCVVQRARRLHLDPVVRRNQQRAHLCGPENRPQEGRQLANGGANFSGTVRRGRSPSFLLTVFECVTVLNNGESFAS